MDIKKQFGSKLREIRIQKGLTQEKLSEAIGIQPENYSRLENGLSFPKPDNISKLAKSLDIEIAELFQFNQLDNYDEILKKVLNKLKNDKDTTILVYRFLKTLGKV